MKYGYFDDHAREYVITQPDTPLPWINYLGSEKFFSIISNTGGGYCFYQDPRFRRLIRYRYNNTPLDIGGRFLYLRDSTTGEFWSPTWQPVRRDLENYNCRHGLGYTIIDSQFMGIQTSTRFFVPLNDNLEIWDVLITNRRDSEISLSLFSCVEFNLWDAYDDATNFQRNFNIGEVEVAEDVIYHKTEYRERRDHFAYFGCSEPIHGFDTQRRVFLGTYRGWDRPEVVETGESRGSIAQGWAPIGAQHLKLSINPNQEKRILFVLGYFENPPDQKFDPPESQHLNKIRLQPTLEKYLTPKEADSAFTDLRTYWSKLLDILQITTPDEHTNRMVNHWNPYQCMVTFNLSRSASYFDSGIGRGMGFRDSNQDLLGFVQMVPERARERILDLASTQLTSGGAYHQYQPLTKRGNDEIGGDFNDDPHWLILSTAAYLKETGDWDLLQEKIPYENLPGTESSLYEHLQRGMQYTLDRLGPHGLPLIGRADWNDCLNLNTFSSTPGETFQRVAIKEGTTAESIFIAGLSVLSAKELSAIASHLGLLEDQTHFSEYAEKMTQTVLKHGWDGEWFLRAYDDRGEKIGSRLCEEGQIFIESQGFCIMAGIGQTDGKARQALDSVEAHLATEHGIVLHQPAYTRYYLHLGEISSYPPGYKENAGVFCHTNPWIMIAEATLGNPDRAYDYYLRINPSVRESISEVHRCEPYVYAQMIAGVDAPTFGEAKNSWLTGTAAWNFVAISQWILGIRPTFEGLQISPSIPTHWDGFEAMRLYRGVKYHIQVKRIGPGDAQDLKVDGQSMPGNTIPLPPEGTKSINVTVNIG